MTSLIKNPLETLKLAQDYICDFINEFYNINQAHIRTVLIFLLYYLNFSMYSDFLINLNYNIGVCLGMVCFRNNVIFWIRNRISYWNYICIASSIIFIKLPIVVVI